MKETGTVHWAAPNTGATNSSGFTGLPAGDRDLSGTFIFLATYGDFWPHPIIIHPGMVPGT